MTDLPLSVSERKRLVQMIARRGAVDTYDRQRNFVENCGLDLISDRLRYGDTPGNFAQMLIRESQQAGIIGTPPTHALLNVLQYLRNELVGGHPDELLFVDTLLGRSIPEVASASQPSHPQTTLPLKDTVPGLSTAKRVSTTPPVATRYPSSNRPTAPASSAQSTTAPEELPFFLLDVWWYGAALLLFFLGGAAGWLADALMGWVLSVLDYPRYLSQELVVGAGGLCGLVYAVAGALGYPIDRSDYFNSVFDSYLLLWDGLDFGERVAGLLTSLPLNLLAAVALTYGFKLMLLSVPGISELSESATQSLFVGILGVGWILRWFTEA